MLSFLIFHPYVPLRSENMLAASNWLKFSSDFFTPPPSRPLLPLSCGPCCRRSSSSPPHPYHGLRHAATSTAPVPRLPPHPCHGLRRFGHRARRPSEAASASVASPPLSRPCRSPHRTGCRVRRRPVACVVPLPRPPSLSPPPSAQCRASVDRPPPRAASMAHTPAEGQSGPQERGRRGREEEVGVKKSKLEPS